MTRIVVIWATLMGVAGVAGVAGADERPAGQAPLTGTTATAKPSSRHHKKVPKRGAGPKASLACSSDADCALTNYADGDCCPSLCPQRAVSAKSAEALAKYGAECKKPDALCPVPECMPREITAACVAGKCAVRAASRE